MIDTYRKILSLLNARERRQFQLLLVLFVFGACMEAAGVIVIVPFVTVVSNPDVINSNGPFGQVYRMFDFSNRHDFLEVLSIGVLAVVVIRIATNAAIQYAVLRFGEMRNCSLSCRLLQRYLDRPYIWFSSRHTAELGRSVLSESAEVVNGAIVPAMQLLSYLCAACFVAGAVILMQPWVALTMAALIGSAYLLAYLATRNFLLRMGRGRIEANKERFRYSQDAIAGIKEIKVMGMEESCVRRFMGPAVRFGRFKVAGIMTGFLPRYIVEAVVFIGMVLLVVLQLRLGGAEFGVVAPVLGLYALAAYRLLPMVQQIFLTITKMRFSKPALDNFCGEMSAGNGLEQGGGKLTVGAVPIPLTTTLELQNVRFTYPDAERPALQGVTLSIPARATIGIVGATGAGKSTIVDIILGLVRPQEGRLCVDGREIRDSDVRGWQKSIGYVPQHIFLVDDTIAGNIAFASSVKQIDMAAVRRAARIADLHDFIEAELPKGYETMIGERGVRLSGGQRQRIGIARALYHDPSVLLLDEATSALDYLTERAVMEAIDNVGHHKTIVLISHRLTSVKACDTILMMERGRVIASGTYEDLIVRETKFREIAGAR